MNLTLFVMAALFVDYLSRALVIAIMLRAIFSWFMKPGDDNMIMRVLRDVTEPIIAPLRRVIPNMGMLDLSPLVAMLLVQWIGNLLANMLRSTAGI